MSNLQTYYNFKLDFQEVEVIYAVLCLVRMPAW